MKKLATLSFAILTFTLFSFGQVGSSMFSFRGKVFLDLDKGKNVTVSLYDNNKRVSRYETGKNGKFLLDVERNKHYTLVFEKEGYVTKRVIIDTEVNHNDAVGVNEFKFDISLLLEEEGIDYSDLDFPITLIEFEKSERQFSYNREYTNNMLEVQDKIISKSSSLASR